MARNSAWLLVLLLCMAPPAPAITIAGLYEAEVSVTDQTAAARKQAVGVALGQVLVRLTGERRAPEGTALVPVLDRAENYVQQYRYSEVEVPADGGTGRPARELRLWVRFDEDALERDLSDLAVPLWGMERPSTLLWLVLADESGRNWVTAEDHPEIQGLIEVRARARGIAFLAPLLDLQDASALQTSDVWGGFAAAVLQASERYQADTVLSAVIESTAKGIWEGRWTAFIKGETPTWTTDGDLPEVVVEEGIDRLADLLAEHYAPRNLSAAVGDVSITVSDISDVDQYARVLHYLESLNLVTDIRVTRVEPGQVSFMLTAHGGEAAVDQAIVLGRVLERLSDASGNLYRLMP